MNSSKAPFDWTISNRLRADFMHREIARWDTIIEAADEIDRLLSDQSDTDAQLDAFGKVSPSQYKKEIDTLVAACRRALVDLKAAKLLAQHTLGEPHGINQTIEIVETALKGYGRDVGALPGSAETSREKA